MKEPRMPESMPESRRILCIGDLCADLIVPYGRGTENHVLFRQGGTVANTAAVLGKLKEKPVFITPVGKDDAGGFLLEEMGKNGVDMSYAGFSEKGSMICIAVLDQWGERTMFHWVPPWGDYPRFSAKDFPDQLLDVPSIIFTGGMVINQDYESAEAVLGFLGRMMERGGSYFIFDLNPRTESYGMDEKRRSLYHRFTELADMVIGSGLEEFRPVFGKDTVEACVKDLVRAGKTVIEHSGARPVRVFTSGGVREVPTYEARPVSTVGAGDAFNGALIHALKEKKDMIECVRYANYIAAYVISHEGHFILPG